MYVFYSVFYVNDNALVLNVVMQSGKALLCTYLWNFAITITSALFFWIDFKNYTLHIKLGINEFNWTMKTNKKCKIKSVKTQLTIIQLKFTSC